LKKNTNDKIIHGAIFVGLMGICILQEYKLNMKIHPLLLVGVNFFVSFQCLATDKTDANPVERNYYRNYARMTFEIGRAGFIDRATSPLLYQGQSLGIGLDHWVMTSRWHYGFGAWGRAGRYIQDFNQTFQQAEGLSFGGHMHIGRYLLNLSGNKFPIYIGGSLSNQNYIRQNLGFMNSANGFETITSLHFAFSGRVDMSRRQVRIINLGLFSLRLREIKREVIWECHPGLLQAAYRNGYAYIFDNPALFENEPLADYHLFWGGLNLQTHLAWKWYKQNGNGYAISYRWYLQQTRGDFEFYQHSLGITLLFQNKIKS
jgi:hypothetical protein